MAEPPRVVSFYAILGARAIQMPIDLARLREKARQQNGVDVVSERDLAEAERALGFALPPLLLTIYREVSGGAFGPGYGFYGLAKGTKLFPDETAAGLYTSFRTGDPDDPTFSWPEKLLPLVDWGCAIRSCADCRSPSLPIIRFDPTKEGPAQFEPEDLSLEDWLQAWLDGRDLWPVAR